VGDRLVAYVREAYAYGGEPVHTHTEYSGATGVLVGRMYHASGV